MLAVRTRGSLIALGASVAFLAACGGGSKGAPAQVEEAPAPVAAEEPAAPQTATVRFVHASAKAPTVNISANGDVLLEKVAPGTWNPQRLEVPAGEHTIELTPSAGKDVVFAATVTFAPEGDYTVVVLGDPSGADGEALDALVLEDDLSETKENASRMRFLHAVPGAPATSLVTDGGDSYAVGTAYKTVTPWVAGPAASTKLTLNAGSDAVASETIGFADGMVFTLIAMPKVTEQGVTILSITDKAE